MNENELKKIIIDELIKTFGNERTADTYFDTTADNIISKLPDTIITEDKIVEVLKKHTELIHYMPEHRGVWNESQGDKYLGRQSDVIHSWQFTPIAQEILKDNKWEVVASGEVKAEISELDIYFIKGRQVNFMFKKYKGENVEVAIKKL